MYENVAIEQRPRIVSDHIIKGKVVICARMGDPILQQARARSIWAAQTAQAARDLGLNTVLTGSAEGLPVSVQHPEGLRACRRLLASFYNVTADFGVELLYPPEKPDPKREYGAYELSQEFSRHVLPTASLVHTRDPRVVKKCVALKIPVIYEDHNEDFHEAMTNPEWYGLLDHACKLIVAITPVVKQRLVQLGVPADKIFVAESGVNPRAQVRSPERVASWRRFLLMNRYTSIATYTGGMQVERGIDHVLFAASRLKDTLFVMAGGNEKDVGHWRTVCQQGGLHNVRVYGYVPQETAIELQQASDVVLMSRQPGPRGEITSPLKFFEYLASGTPLVAANIDSLADADLSALAINWYSPLRPHTIVDAIERSLAQHGVPAQRVSANVDYSRRYVWAERQARIFTAAGFALPSSN